MMSLIVLPWRGTGVLFALPALPRGFFSPLFLRPPLLFFLAVFGNSFDRITRFVKSFLINGGKLRGPGAVITATEPPPPLPTMDCDDFI